MVVDDLQDLCLVSSGNGLGQFIMIDKNEANRIRAGQIGAGEHTDHGSLMVDDRKQGLASALDKVADVADRFLFGDGGNVAVDRGKNAPGAPNLQAGRGGIPGADDHAHPILPGPAEQGRVEVITTGDDEAAHTIVDGKFLNRGPVAADDDQLFGGERPHVLFESPGFHRPHHLYENFVPFR